MYPRTLAARSGEWNTVITREPAIQGCYNAAVFRKNLTFTATLLSALLIAGKVFGQESKPAQKPQVKVNMLNVCSPSPEEQQEISAALARIPRHPSFSPDFEVDRGRSILDQNANLLAIATTDLPTSSDAVSADFVRIRHDFTGTSPYSGVQYSFSRDTQQMVETLVFRMRDAKDVLQVSIDDTASTVTTATAMLTAATPANRIRLERFGKSSVVLARCAGQNGGPSPNQSAYEPLFSSASSILSEYRVVLDASRLVPEELARIAGAQRARPKKPSTLPRR
jgi:hypothetical protein